MTPFPDFPPSPPKARGQKLLGTEQKLSPESTEVLIMQLGHGQDWDSWHRTRSL